MLRKLLTPNIQRIESICAIGKMLQQVLLRFRILLCGLVFEGFALKFHVKRLRLRLRIFFSKFLFVRVEIRLGNLYNIRQTHLIMRIKLSYLERCTCLLRSFNVLTSVEVSAYTDRSKQILLVANY